MKKAYEMNLTEFIEAHEGRFVKEKGKINYCGVLSVDGYTVYPLPPLSQKRGKLIKHANEILGHIHKLCIASRVQSFINGMLPNALPFEKKIAPVDTEILDDYPDLLKRQQIFLNNQGGIS